MKECEICVWKYSCGYSAIRIGKETSECCEPHLFKQKRKNVWSYKNQKLESENIVRKEENLKHNHGVNVE